MSFDKIKAMRSAERFLSQGKIRAAIGEYKRIVDDNPKDYSTINILGDLYAKDDDFNEAVECFRQVADHYNGQGFANKAIAIYNKINRLKPESMEISAKLAQLYQLRGSFAEARDHYTRLAENYQKRGQKIEALAIWKQIAELDPNNTQVYLTIAESCLQENQKSEACDAFTDAGLRFNGQQQFEEAVEAFTNALKIKPENLKTLDGFVIAKIGLGCADEAADKLEQVLKDNPYNRDILYMLVNCLLEMNDPGRAEPMIIKLVQQEPANYPKFLELVEVYLKDSDLGSAVRVLSISTDSLLGGGQSDEFLELTNEILKRNPEQIDALQLLVTYHTWHHNDNEIRAALERVAESARINQSIEEEKQALIRLARMDPQNTDYTNRLQELKDIYGFDDIIIQPEADPTSAIPQFENFAGLNEDRDTSGAQIVTGQDDFGREFSFADDSNDYSKAAAVDDEEQTHQTTEFAFADDSFENFDIERNIATDEVEFAGESVFSEEIAADSEPSGTKELTDSDEKKILNEVESIEFYIAQGYMELAQKCIDSLEEEFGESSKSVELRSRTGESVSELIEAAEINISTPLEVPYSEPAEFESVPQEEQLLQEVADDLEEVSVFEQFRNELGLEDEPEDPNESDYSTHYQTAIAYKEMGLMEEAIKEFQDAVNLIHRNDGTRRYFQCANLMGHCFMMKGMPNLALTWFERALETENLNENEIQALNYEVASAYEASGEKEKAFEYFGQIYALDVDYRDIGQRMENLREVSPS